MCRIPLGAVLGLIRSAWKCSRIPEAWRAANQIAPFRSMLDIMQFDSFDELTETLVSLHEPGQLTELTLRSRAMLRYRGELEQRSTELWRRAFERLLRR